MNLYILGNGSYSQEIFEYFIYDNYDAFKGFITMKENIMSVVDFEGVSEYKYDLNDRFIVGTNSYTDEVAIHFIKAYPSFQFPSMISPLAKVSTNISLDYGNIIAPFVTISGNCRIGKFNRFQTHSGIRYNATIKDNNTFEPYSNIAGNCTVGSNNLFSYNSHMSENLTVKDNNFISAGECLFDDLESNKLFQSGIITNKRIK